MAENTNPENPVTPDPVAPPDPANPPTPAETEKGEAAPPAPNPAVATPQSPPDAVASQAAPAVEADKAVERLHPDFTYLITPKVIHVLQNEDVPEDVTLMLGGLIDREYLREERFVRAIEQTIGREHTVKYQPLIVAHSKIGKYARIWYRNKLMIVIGMFLTAFLLVFLWSNIVISVDSGHAGVLWHRFSGTDMKYVYTEGVSAILPIDRMYIYDMRIIEIHDTVNVLSSNGLVIRVSFSARFQLQIRGLPVWHKTVGPDYIEKIVKPEVISAIRRVIGNYTPEEIYAKDEQGLLVELLDDLRDRLDQNYVYFHNILIKELMLPEEIQTAIKNKLTQEQNQLAYAYLLQREEQEKTRKQIEAEGIRIFEQTTGLSILKWKGIEATLELSKSPNSKVVIMGNGSDGLPVILNSDK